MSSFKNVNNSVVFDEQNKGMLVNRVAGGIYIELEIRL